MTLENTEQMASSSTLSPIVGCSVVGRSGFSGWRLSIVCGLAFSVTFSLGCEQLLGRNQVQCDQSVATVRQAISFGQFDSAKKWRDYTWKVCGDTPVVTALDQELVQAKQKAEQDEIAAVKRAREVAQRRINAAQRIWLTFDALKSRERTAEALAAAMKSAQRQGEGLDEVLGKKLVAYNKQQRKLRKARLKR